jgi:hypothetical protein
MVSKVSPPQKPPLSIEVDEDARGGKSLIYKPENKGSGLQTYSSQASKPTSKPGKSPIALQLTEIIEKFKPSFVEESHDQQLLQDSPREPNHIEEAQREGGGSSHNSH